MTADGVPLNVVTNLRNTQTKRKKIVIDANLPEIEVWQRKIFAKNAKKGWRFFQPDSIGTPTPRSAREAWGGVYKNDNSEKNELKAQKIMACIFVIALLLLSTL